MRRKNAKMANRIPMGIIFFVLINLLLFDGGKPWPCMFKYSEHKMYKVLNKVNKSCTGSCGNDRLVWQPCYCDDICILYDDCCFDYLDACNDNDNKNKNVSAKINTIFSCGLVRDEFVLKSVKNCPFKNREFVNETLISLCENKSLNILKQNIPVFFGSAIFDNQYCAECNLGELILDELKGFEMKITCDDTLKATNIWKDFGDEALLEYAFHSCSVIFKVPKGTKNSFPTCFSNKTVSVTDIYLPKYSKKYENIIDSNNSFINLPLDNCGKYYNRDSYFERVVNLDYGSWSLSVLFDVSTLIKKDHLQTSKGKICRNSTFRTALGDSCTHKSCGPNMLTIGSSCMNIELLAAHSILMGNLDTVLLLDKGQAGSVTFSSIDEFVKMVHNQRMCPRCASIDPISLYVTKCMYTNALEFLQKDEMDESCAVIKHPLGKSDLSHLCYMNTKEWSEIGVRKIFQAENVYPCRMGNFRWDHKPIFLTKGDNPILHPKSLYVQSSLTNIIYKFDSVPKATVFTLTKTQKCFLNSHKTDSIVRIQSYRIGVCWDPIASCPAKNLVLVNNKSLDDGYDYRYRVHVSQNETIACRMKQISMKMNLLTYVTIIGGSTSIVSFVVLVVIHHLKPSLGKGPGGVVLQLLLSLCLSQVFFLLSGFISPFKTWCKIVAIAQHFFWLSSFTLMTTYSILLSLMFVRLQKLLYTRVKTILIRFLAWGISFLIVFPCLVLDQLYFKSEIYGEATANNCWISDYDFLVYSFICPVSISLSINFVCFCLSCGLYIKTKQQLPSQNTDLNNKSANLVMFCKMALIMGLPWVFGILANFDILSFLNVPYVVLNSFQGLFILSTSFCNSRLFSFLSRDTRSTSRTFQTAGNGINDNIEI